MTERERAAKFQTLVVDCLDDPDGWPEPTVPILRTRADYVRNLDALDPQLARLRAAYHHLVTPDSTVLMPGKNAVEVMAMTHARETHAAFLDRLADGMAADQRHEAAWAVAVGSA